MIRYPKIYNLGRDETVDVLKGTCDIYEKVDGSQFKWSVDEIGELKVYTKSTQLVSPWHNVNRLFKTSVYHLLGIKDNCHRDLLYFGEAISKPKHNKIKYDRVPQGNTVLWAAWDTMLGCWLTHDRLQEEAKLLEIDCIPLLGVVKEGMDTKQLDEFLDTESFLGGAKIEGIVIKNYSNFFNGTANLDSVVQAKYVSEKFREMAKFGNPVQHDQNYGLDFDTEIAWQKAYMRMCEGGLAEGNDKDIGKVIRELHRDIDEEYKPIILKYLWKIHSKNVKSRMTRGLADWMKAKMARRLLDEN